MKHDSLRLIGWYIGCCVVWFVRHAAVFVLCEPIERHGTHACNVVVGMLRFEPGGVGVVGVAGQGVARVAGCHMVCVWCACQYLIARDLQSFDIQVLLVAWGARGWDWPSNGSIQS